MGDPGGDGADGTDGSDGRNPYLVGPGLEIEILDASIDTSNVARVRYRLTDSGGRPLDLDGLFTEGAVSPRFLLAWLDETDTGEPLQYTSYSTNSDGQASTDSGGVNVEIGVGDGPPSSACC